jgi:hypothetical protein
MLAPENVQEAYFLHDYAISFHIFASLPPIRSVPDSFLISVLLVVSVGKKADSGRRNLTEGVSIFLLMVPTYKYYFFLHN